MSINWQSVGNQKFNVLDQNFGFWANDGFVRDQHKAKVYTQDQLTEQELKTIEDTPCVLMSA